MKKMSSIKKSLLQLRVILDLIDGERNINQLERELYIRLKDELPLHLIYTYTTLHRIVDELEELGLVVSERKGKGRVIVRTMLGDELLNALKRLNGSLFH